MSSSSFPYSPPSIRILQPPTRRSPPLTTLLLLPPPPPHLLLRNSSSMHMPINTLPARTSPVYSSSSSSPWPTDRPSRPLSCASPGYPNAHPRLPFPARPASASPSQASRGLGSGGRPRLGVLPIPDRTSRAATDRMPVRLPGPGFQGLQAGKRPGRDGLEWRPEDSRPGFPG